MRKAIAHKLTTSRREIPDATTWVDADATELMATKDALKVARPQDAIGILPLLARITVAGLRQFAEPSCPSRSTTGSATAHRGWLRYVADRVEQPAVLLASL